MSEDVLFGIVLAKPVFQLQGARSDGSVAERAVTGTVAFVAQEPKCPSPARNGSCRVGVPTLNSDQNGRALYRSGMSVCSDTHANTLDSRNESLT